VARRSHRVGIYVPREARAQLRRLLAYARPTMKFAAKYEILEAYTRGAVETFAARKIATDEVVLVHIFECQEQQPNQPTVQWVLESFRAMAPDPCGRVVDAGRYDETSYGYLVTRLPEKPALQAWIQSYEVRRAAEDETSPPGSSAASPSAEGATPETRRVPASDAATRAFGVKAPPERPEGITKEFEALRSELKPPAIDPTPSGLHVDHADARSISGEFRAMGFEAPSAKPAEPEAPGDFTRQFSPPADDKPKVPPAISDKTPRPAIPEARRDSAGITGRTPAPGTKVQPPPTGASAETPSAMLRKLILSTPDSAIASRPDRAFQSGSTPKPKQPPVTGKAGEPGTGEFTKFFRGPFDGERPAETPDLSGAAPRKDEKDTGDFTKVFGRPKGDTSGQLPKFKGPPGPKPTSTGSDPGSFTRLFDSEDIPNQASGAYESDEPPKNRSNFGSGEFPSAKPQATPKPFPRPAPISAVTPAPTTPLAERRGVSDPELPFATHSGREDATRVFSAGREPAPGVSTLPAGPSEYTRVISGGLKKYGLSEEPGAEPQSSAGHTALSSVPPPMPAAPATPQFPPLGGQPQVPAPPQPPVLPAAQAPALGAAAPKAAGPPWTMIIILNVLFLLALALVLYFIFRH